MDTDLEDLRVMSLLSEIPHEQAYEGKRYVAYAGYVLTYNTFATMMLWTITGPKIYHAIWQERPGAVQEVRDLNPQDQRLLGMHDDHIGQYICDQFRMRMGSMAPDDVEALFNNMFFEHIESQIA